MPTLRLYLLGQFYATVDDRPLEGFRSVRARALLAYLTLESTRPLSRTHLARLLWDGQDPEAARSNLRVTLSNLRQILKPLNLIRTTNQVVQLQVKHPDFWCDALAHDLAALEPPPEEADSSPPRPLDADWLYQHDLLAGFEVIDSELFQIWLQERRKHYRQLLRALTPGAITFGRPQPSTPDTPPATYQVESPPAVTLPPKLMAPTVGAFFGREPELEQLRQWVLDDQARLVMVLGMGGQGKTALVARFMRMLNSVNGAGEGKTNTGWPQEGRPPFARLFWRSLLNAPPLDEVLQEWVGALANQQIGDLPPALDRQLELLLTHLQRQRCLLVLDNVESIMSTGERAGHCRPGYERYEQLFQRIAEYDHQSCLLLTSREEPYILKRLEIGAPAVRSLRLEGLAIADAQAMMREVGLISSPEEITQIAQGYSGNPLALKLVVAAIQDIFAGDVGAFLTERALVFDDIRDVLDQHFERLSPVEQEVISWLAIEREPVTLTELSDDLVKSTSQRVLLETLRSLQRRSLLERDGTRHGLQNVVLEYTTDRLVESICRELLDLPSSVDHPLVETHLNRFALVKAQAKEYVRQSQVRMLLQPVIETVTRRWSKEAFAQRLQRHVDHLRIESPQAPGYAAANVLHLLLQLGIDLRHHDFSRLVLWQADLRGVTLHGVNFRDADLSRSLFMQPFETVYSLTFSPDGQRLATGTDNGEVHVWRLNDQQVERIFVGHTGQVWTVAFSPDGNLLASGAEDHTVRLWDLVTDEPLQVLHGLTASVKVVRFNATSEWLLAADENGVAHLWDIRTSGRAVTHGQPEITYQLGINYVNEAAATLDGALLAYGGGDRIVYLRDAQSGQLRATLSGHADTILDLAFSPDGKLLASSSADQTVRLWSIDEEENVASYSQLRHELLASQTRFVCLAFSPDGKMLATCLASGIYLWAVEPGSITRLLQHLGGSASKSTKLAFTPDGNTLVSANYDQTIRFWDVHSGQATRTWFGRAEALLLVTYSPDGTTVAGSYFDRTVHVWDRAGNHLHRLRGHQDPVRALAYSPDGDLIATASDDRTVRLWDVRTGRLIHTLRGHTNLVRTLVFHPQGALLASGSYDHTVQLWDRFTGQHREPLEGHAGPIMHLTMSPDGTLLATASEDHTIGLWDVGSALGAGQLRLMLSGHTDFVRWVAFSPDGAQLASCSNDKTVRLWHVASGQLLHTLEGHTAFVHTVLYGRDSATLVSAGADRTVRIWGLDPVGERWELRYTLDAAIYKYSCVALSPDGSTLAVGGMDMCVRLWDVQSGQLLRTLAGHSNLVTAVDFDADGGTAVSSSSDGAVRIWELQTGKCLHVLRPEGPYAGMNISGVTGISETQRSALMALGAVEQSMEPSST